jgi:ribosomal protein S18 acetylase RimI-like enzyme
MRISQAVECFIQAYVHLQAGTTQAEQRKIAGLPCVHFGAGVDAGEALADEIVVHGLGVGQAVERIRAAAPGLPHWLTVFTPDPAADLEEGLRQGYLLDESEYLMLRELDETAGAGPVEGEIFARRPGETILRRAVRKLDVIRINAARRCAVFHPDQLDDPAIEIVLIEKQSRILAWGASLLLKPDAVYITNMYTRPEHRREGLAGAVLRELLARAELRGAKHSLLVSSLAGRSLYQRLGYRVLCDCLVLRLER